MLTKSEVEWLLEVVRSAYTELEAVEASYGDYAASGDLMDSMEQAIELLEVVAE